MERTGQGLLYGGEQRRARHDEHQDVVMNEASEGDMETKMLAAQEIATRDMEWHRCCPPEDKFDSVEYNRLRGSPKAEGDIRARRIYGGEWAGLGVKAIDRRPAAACR